MKKHLLLTGALALLGYCSNAQVWSENFNSGIPSNWVKVKVDNNTPSGSFNAAIVSGLTSQAWMSWLRAAGDSAALTASWFDPVGKADRWLITPSFTVSDPNMVLTWEDFSPDGSYLDSLQVLISTTAGTTPAAFTTTLYNAASTASDFTKRGIVLGTNYNGQTVRIAFRDNSTDKFLLYVDNAATEILPSLDGKVGALDVAKFALSNTPVKVYFQNTGITPITSATLTYAIDGGTAVSQTFSGLNLAPFGGQWLTFTTPMTTAVGMHSVVVNLTQTNGAADPVTTNNSGTATFTTPSGTTTRNGIMEEFTSSTCAPCASFNSTFDPLINQPINVHNTATSRFNIIKYQMNWPSPGNDVSYNAHGATRRDYYQVSGIPDHYTNGKAGGAGNQTEIDNSKLAASYVTMSGSYRIKQDTLIATVTITPNFTLTNAGMKLHVAALQDSYVNPGATTSQSNYYSVMRLMFPDGNGTTINNFTAGTPQTFTFKQKYTVGSVTQMSNNFWFHPISGSMVAFLQDDATGDVLQSTAARAEWTTGVENVNTAIGDVALFPNPSSDFTTLVFNLDKAASVNVSVLDNLGRVVYSNNEQMTAGAQRMTIPTANLAAGAYNVNIQTENGNATQRLSVIK